MYLDFWKGGRGRGGGVAGGWRRDKSLSALFLFPPPSPLEGLILRLVTACLTCCILVLIRQWTAFLSAASTAGYVYLYSFYYFFFKTK